MPTSESHNASSQIARFHVVVAASPIVQNRLVSGIVNIHPRSMVQVVVTQANRKKQRCRERKRASTHSCEQSIQSCHGDAQCCIVGAKEWPRGCCSRRRTCPRREGPAPVHAGRRSRVSSSRRRGNRYSQIRDDAGDAWERGELRPRAATPGGRRGAVSRRRGLALTR